MITAGVTPGTARRRGFTLIELLVVISVITILVALAAPTILNAIKGGQMAKCQSNLHQIGLSVVSYGKDYNTLMPCGGTSDYGRAGHIWTGPTASSQHDEEPWNPVTWTQRNPNKYPYWYEAVQPYLSPGAGYITARASLVAQGTASPSRNQIRDEIARIAGIFTCPSKKQAPFGYGFNYCAPFGVSYGPGHGGAGPAQVNSGVYPNWPKTSPQKVTFHYTGFKWPYAKGDNPLGAVTYYNYPINTRGKWATVPVLWYGKQVTNSAITTPSGQIAFCDTGFVTNDKSLTTPPDKWKENSTSNVTGYVRFPLYDKYKASDKYKNSKAWRPVPRHGGRTVCAMFDGSVRALHIRKIVNSEWGANDCLFDNKPAHEPSVPPSIE